MASKVSLSSSSGASSRESLEYELDLPYATLGWFWEVARRLRKIRSSELRSPTYCGQEVGNRAEVGHLFSRDAQYVRLPAPEELQLGQRSTFGRMFLYRKGCEKVLAKEPMFELGRLGQSVDEFFSGVYLAL